MNEIQSRLSGENLTLFLNIQESIQKTSRATSLGGFGSERSYSESLRLSGSRHNRDGTNQSQKVISGKNTAEFGCGYPWDMCVSPLQPSEALPQTLSHVSGTSLRTTLPEVPRTFSRTSDSPSRAPSSVAEVSPRPTLGSKVESNSEYQDWKAQDREQLDLKLYDQIGRDEEQNIYARVCGQYGEECGRRYRLVRSMIAPETNAEPTTTGRSFSQSKTLRQETIACQRTDVHHPANVTCPQITEDVRIKMETLVDIIPSCTTEKIQVPKRWKDVLRGPHLRSRKWLHDSLSKERQLAKSVSEASAVLSCYCGMVQCDCDLNEKCVPPEITKKCDTVNYKVDETNNYLVTCRENLRDKQTYDRRVTVLQQHAIKFARRNTRESAYLQATHDQAENELMTCLMKVMPPQGQEVSQVGTAHVQQLANVISEHKMIDNNEWRIWRHAYAKKDQKDSEMSSLDSDIISSSSDDECSMGDVKFPKSLQPSRIPYFKETFQLANTLFDKIEAKMEKCIYKNHEVEKMRKKRLVSSQLEEKIRLLQDNSSLFNGIIKLFRPNNFYRKRLTPFSVRKQRKRAKANHNRVELRRLQNHRKLIEGSQLGRKYRRPKRSFLYTKQENYRGFSPYRQKILQKTGLERFRNCNLVVNRSSRRPLTDRIFHNDYRLIREMFDDQAKECLWDPGMKARLEEYVGAFREVNDPAEQNEEHLDDTLSMTRGVMESQRRPDKDEQKTQTALPNSWSYCSRSSGNAPEAFASLVRALRSDSKFPAHATTDEKLPKRERDSNQRTATSMSTIIPSGTYPNSELSFLESSSFNWHAKIHNATSLAKSTKTTTTVQR